MADDLLASYKRELDALRHLAGAFAAEHPKIAGRLRLGPDSAARGTMRRAALMRTPIWRDL